MTIPSPTRAMMVSSPAPPMSLNAQLDTVLCYRGDSGSLDYLGIDRHSYRVEHVSARKVDGSCRLGTEVHVGAVRAD